MLCKVIHRVEHILANTWPHKLCWGVACRMDREAPVVVFMATLFFSVSWVWSPTPCDVRFNCLPFVYYISVLSVWLLCLFMHSNYKLQNDSHRKKSKHDMSVTFTFVAPGERESLMIGSGPVISGPVLQDSQTGSLRRNRSNRSVLASAFQNAWKQGTMAAEVGRGWCELEGREGREGGIGRWREGGSDHCSCTKKGKPTKCEIASTLSFSRWTRIQRNGQCLIRPPANKSPDPTRAWPTRIPYHMWRKKCQGCSHWKERRKKRETERIP